MDIRKFLDLAQELETEIFKLYEAVGERSGDPPTAARLKALASDEMNHANVIRRGKVYFDEYPDMFAGIAIDENEAAIGLGQVRALLASVSQGTVPLLEGLRKLLELEKRFERVHVGASVKITEPSLKKLFTSLTQADQSHIQTLTSLIESAGGEAPR